MSVLWVPELLPVAICIFNMQPQWLRDRCCLAYILKLSESKRQLHRCVSKFMKLPVGAGESLNVSVSALLKQFEYVFPDGRELPRSPFSVFWFTPELSKASPVTLARLGFVVCIQSRLWSYFPQRLCFELWFAPSVSHHCFWLSPLTGNERFILSGLNYIVPSWLLVLLHSK